MLELLALAASLGGPGPRLDPRHLPRLPRHGLIREVRSGLGLETMRGRPLGWVPRYRLATGRRPAAYGALLVDRRGREFLLDARARRIRPAARAAVGVPRGCLLSDATLTKQLYICGRPARLLKTMSRGRLRVVARAPRAGPSGAGTWQWAEFSPGARQILAQWQGECEVPIAYRIAGGKVAPFAGTTLRNAPESFALGWLPGQRAVIHYGHGVCGGAVRRPGVYAVAVDGRRTFLRPTALPPPRLAMWGG